MKEKCNLLSHTDIPKLIDAVHSVGYPCKVTITSGADRSLDQNRLQRKWLKEAAQQLGEYTAEQYRALCKLWFGVPIMLDDDDFRAGYEMVIEPLSYEHKLAILAEPLSLPVTSLMSVKQKCAYLDRMYEHFTSKGVNLTQPPDKRYGPGV